MSIQDVVFTKADRSSSGDFFTNDHNLNNKGEKLFIRKIGTYFKNGLKARSVLTLAYLGSLFLLIAFNIAAGPNLIVNGDFEKDPIDKGNGWYIEDAHGNKGMDIWGSNSGGGYPLITWVTDFSHSPGHSGRIFMGTPQTTGLDDEGINDGGFCQGVGGLESNTRYTLSWWSRSQSEPFNRNIVKMTAGGWTDWLMNNHMQGAYEWKKDYVSFMTGRGSGEHGISMNFGEDHPNGRPVYANTNDPYFSQATWNRVGGDPYSNVTRWCCGKFWLDDVSLVKDDLQPLDDLGWTAVASDSNDYYHDGRNSPMKVLDGEPGSYWMNNDKPQYPGLWFQIDMKSPQTFNKIIIEEFGTKNQSPYSKPITYFCKYYPIGYELYVSNDPQNWGSAIASGPGSRGTTINFPLQTGKRYIRIKQTGTGGSDSSMTKPDLWAIADIYVYNTGGTNTTSPLSVQSAEHSVSNNSFYTIMGKQIDMRNIRTKGTGLYLKKMVNGKVSKVIF